MIVEPEISGVSIVLVGSLNPKIFTPDWFARNGLISVGEADAANVQIIHPSVAQFEIDWLSVLVDTKRFQVVTTQAPYVRVHDLAVRVFREFLPHTPLLKLGINRDVHVGLGTQKARDKIGYALAPPEAWGEWAKGIRSGEGDRHGGMMSVTMQQRALDDRPKGFIQATVQPSSRAPAHSGIYVAVNDHYELIDEEVAGAEEIIKILEANFDASLKRSDWIIDQVLRLKDA